MLKKTPNPSHDKTSNLWLGFALGAAITTTIAILFGTKKGRETLKKLLELSENLEENLQAIVDEVQETITDKVDKLQEADQDKPILGTLLDKMKTLRN